MSHEGSGDAATDDLLDLVAAAVRSRSGAWVGVENLAGRCRLYQPGHRVHNIQIRVTYERTRARPVTITGIDGNVITLDVNGRIRRFRNHEPTAIATAVERYGAAAQLRRSLLCVPAGNVEYAFNLKPGAGTLMECR